MSKIDARQFLNDCKDVYGGSLTPENDIPSTANTIDTYADTVNQKKYVHMYFAKYVGCWRAIRKKVQTTQPHNLVSIGAGPLLCAMGWLWDGATRNDRTTVRAYDVLDWKGVRGLPTFDALWKKLVQKPADYEARRFFPEKVRPPQTQNVGNLRSIPVAEIGSDNIVLLPFVLNHLVGLDAPVSPIDQEHVFRWIENVRRAHNKVVIADMEHKNSTADFWQRVTSGLEAPDGTYQDSLVFTAETNDIAQAYSPAYQVKRRGGFGRPQKAGVLYGDQEGWRWIR